MSLQQIVVAAMSLKPMAPALAFLLFSLILVFLPRRASAAFAAPLGLASSFLALLAMLTVGRLDVRRGGDLEPSALAHALPWWLVLISPVLLACVHRSPSLNKGIAVGGVLLANGSLCFAAAASTIPLFLVAILMALLGAAAVPLASASENPLDGHREVRDAVRTTLFILVQTALLLVGMSFLIWSSPRLHFDGAVTSPVAIAGSVLTGIAVFSLLGGGPMASWIRGNGVGIQGVVNVLLLLVGSLVLVKTARTARHPAADAVLWIWAMGSMVHHVTQSSRVKDMAGVWANQWGFLASLAGAAVVAGAACETPALKLGALGLLTFLSLVGSSAAALIESCQLSSLGTVGRPTGVQSTATGAALLGLAGVPPVFAIWAFQAVIAGGTAPGAMAGLRQGIVFALILGAAAGGWAVLRAWTSLKSAPRLPPMESDTRWLVLAGVLGLLIGVAVGVCPRPFFAVLEAVVQPTAVQMPTEPLNP